MTSSERDPRTQARSSSTTGTIPPRGVDARTMPDPSERENQTPELTQTEIAEIEQRLRYLGYID
jgi:hypothetical protein